MSDYTAWLIEISAHDLDIPSINGPSYFKFDHDDDWTTDHNKACHFSRRQDAETVIEHYGWTRAKAVEHMWPDGVREPRTAAGSLD